MNINEFDSNSYQHDLSNQLRQELLKLKGLINIGHVLEQHPFIPRRHRLVLVSNNRRFRK